MCWASRSRLSCTSWPASGLARVDDVGRPDPGCRPRPCPCPAVPRSSISNFCSTPVFPIVSSCLVALPGCARELVLVDLADVAERRRAAERPVRVAPHRRCGSTDVSREQRRGAPTKKTYCSSVELRRHRHRLERVVLLVVDAVASISSGGMPRKHEPASPTSFVARGRRELLAVDDERRQRARSPPARGPWRRGSRRAAPGTSTMRSRCCCAATASFSPPGDLQEPEPREQPGEERARSRRRSPPAARGCRPRCIIRRRTAHRVTAPSLATDARTVPQSRRPAAFRLARAARRTTGNTSGRDQRVVERGDEHGLEARQRQEPVLTHHRARR